MKKIFITLAMVAAVSVACQKQEIVGHVAESEGTFTAKVENFDTSTKTTLATNNHILWSSGDRLAIFQGSSLADEYVLSENSAGKMNGIFNLAEDNSEVNGSFSAGAELPCNVALYPYADDLSLTGSAFEKGAFEVEGLSLPETQCYSPDSFANGAFPMIAVTKSLADHDLCFRNILGAMKLQVKGTQVVKYIKIEGANEERLSGAATVVAYSNNLSPEVRMASDASTKVTLDCGDGVQLSETDVTNFIVALPPVVFENGFTITITDSADETYSISARVKNTIVRSSILTMSAITLSDSGEVTTDPEEQTFSVKFKDPIFEEYVVSHFDLDCDGFLSYEEATKIIAVNVPSKKITDFTGIEHMINLEALDCSDNKMTELYLKANTKLKRLNCESCHSLDTLDLSGSVNLENLSCRDGEIRVVDLKVATKLKYLKLMDMSYLQEVKLKDASALEYVAIGGTYSSQSEKLKTVDLSTCTSLRELYIENSGISSLNLTSCVNLEVFECGATYLESLDLSRCVKLKTLDMYNTVDKRPMISFLELGDIPYITSVKMNKAPYIKVCGTKLEHILCGYADKYNNYIQDVDFSGCTNLKSVSIVQFSGELNLSNITHLKDVDVYNATISKFNFEGSENIESLILRGAVGYYYIYVSNWEDLYLPKLKSFSVSNLAKAPDLLDLSKSPLLEHVTIQYNNSSFKTLILNEDVKLDETSTIPETVTVQYE